MRTETMMERVVSVIRKAERQGARIRRIRLHGEAAVAFYRQHLELGGPLLLEGQLPHVYGVPLYLQFR